MLFMSHAFKCLLCGGNWNGADKPFGEIVRHSPSIWLFKHVPDEIWIHLGKFSTLKGNETQCVSVGDQIAMENISLKAAF